MKLEEMVNEFPMDFLSVEEMRDLIKEKMFLERELELTKKEIELTEKEIELTRKDTELMKKEIELIKREKKNPIKEFNPNYLCNPWCDYLTEDGDCLLGWSCGDCGEEYGDDDE